MRGVEPMFAFLWADLASPLLIASNVHFLGKMSGCETSGVIGRLPTSDNFHTGRRSTQRRYAKAGHINRVVVVKTPTGRHQSLHVALRFCENSVCARNSADYTRPTSLQGLRVKIFRVCRCYEKGVEFQGTSSQWY